MKAITSRVICALILLFGLACEPKQVLDETFLKISDQDKAVNFLASKSAQTISISSNAKDWTFSVEKDAKSWLKVTKKDKSIRLSTTENQLVDERKTVLTVSAGKLSEEIKITQMGTGSNILVSPTSLTANEFSDVQELSITSNVEYEIKLPSWITIKSDNIETANDGVKIHKYVLAITDNTSEGERRAEIDITTKQAPIITKSVPVTQKKGYENNSNTTSLSDDIKLTISSGTSSSHQPGSGEIENSYDGKLNTIYHSHWNQTTFPVTLTYYFNKAQDVDYMNYIPRQDASSNGNFKLVTIEYSTDGNTYTKVMDYDFEGSKNARRVYFENGLSNVKSFRLIVQSGSGDNGRGFASAAEVEFWQINKENFDPSTIFTDSSCSELKDGVTVEQINAIKNPFFKNIARYIKENSYPSEFRIQEYRAWKDPWVVRNYNKMQFPYSNLDNPTGIRVDKGEELVVLVGPSHGKNISIKIQDLNKPGGDGFGNAENHTLYEGVNKITTNHKGLIYLQYKDPAGIDAPKIKVHFATGTVNGYFDSQKHKPEDFTKLLNNATDKYFDVIGRNAHLCFETADFKAYTHGRGKDLIDTFDDLLDQTHKFDGTDTGARKMTNRAYFQVMYTAYMYCTNYRTSYNKSTMHSLCNTEKMRKANWGPAHEVGHSHQIAPAFMWIGLTECTVNMNSMNIQTAWEIPTRLQTERMGVNYKNRYGKAFNLAFVDKNPFCNLGDVFCNLVPFWQLNLYFSKVKGIKDFSVKYYDKMRSIERVNGKNDGEYQVDFTKSFSELTQTDLTDFFEKWGYYREVNKMIEDYARRNLTVTKAYADRIKSEIKGRKYPELGECIEYITDSNWQFFKDKANVVKGSATKQTTAGGTQITCNNYQNAVAFEVRDKNDNLIFVSNEAQFTVNKAFDENTKVYAIAYNRQRTEVTF